jgi:hypothetical protein
MSRRQRKRALEVRAIGRPWQSPFSSRPQIWQSEICGATKMLKRGIKSRLSRLSSHRVPDHHVFSLYKTTPNSWAWPCVDADDERCSRSAIAQRVRRVRPQLPIQMADGRKSDRSPLWQMHRRLPCGISLVKAVFAVDEAAPGVDPVSLQFSAP